MVSGRSVKCNAIFAVYDLSALVDVWYVLPCGYLTFPIYGNTMLRYEQQTFTTLFCTLKSDFMDVKRFSKFIWAVVHYYIVHIFPRRSIIV